MLEKQKLLTEKLNKAASAYYNTGNPIMSDYEYDKLYDELKALEKQTGVVFSGSPTQFVGYEVITGLQKIKHSKPALSLNKTKNPNDIASFLGSNAGVLSWKLDGMTVVLTYNDDGVLVKAATRGDGYIGEDITHAAPYINGIPLKLAVKGKRVVRGECFITYDDFKRINETLPAGTETYKNPRNLASGSLRLMDTKEISKRKLQFLLFNCVEGFENIKTLAEQFAYCTKLGFAVVPHQVVTANNVVQGLKLMGENTKKVAFPVDGAVIALNDCQYAESLGVVGKYPRGAMAFKWADTVEKTILRSIEWQVGKSGAITPVAVFDPVELEGTTVTRASVHNRDIMTQLRLTVGDRIGVYKANMIIPQIATNFDYDKHLGYVAPMPPVIDIQQKQRAMAIQQLKHFVDREAMNIVGVSEGVITKLYDAGLVRNYCDFYKLYYKGAFENHVEGFTEKTRIKLIQSIEESKNTTAERVLYSLSIPQIGRSASKAVCQFVHGDLTQLLNNNVLVRLTEIQDFGEVMRDNMIEYFKDTKNATYFLWFLNAVNIQKPAPVVQSTNSRIAGKTFVVTGSVQYYNNRNELQAEIESLGGKVASSVSKNTDYLINNDINSTSGKNAKAKSLGIPIISEEQYRAMR